MRPSSPAEEHLVALMRLGPFAVITGAGLSTASGIPAYRDQHGQWQHSQPIQHQDFLRSEAVRQRYWARSFVGWPTIGQATPNEGHRALAALAQLGVVHGLITQNVDGLHQRAGSEAVIELHGGIASVRCLACQRVHARSQMQAWLEAANPDVDRADWLGRAAPDGDAHLADALYARFRVPACPACEGVLKPDVVFFGDNVPAARVAQATQAVADASGLLIVGSSLMVYSGFRFAEMAHRLGKPVVAINQGVTRADALLTAKIEGDCGEVLTHLLQVFQA